MHAGAGTIHEWFRHKRRAVAMLLGDRPDHLPRGDQLVSQLDGRKYTEIELLLTGSGFMVSAAAGDAEISEAGNNLVAQQRGAMSSGIEIAARVGGRERSVREGIFEFMAVVSDEVILDFD